MVMVSVSVSVSDFDLNQFIIGDFIVVSEL